MDFRQVGNKRLTVAACQGSYVRFSITDVTALSKNTTEVTDTDMPSPSTAADIKMWELKSIDGPFTVTRFFTLHSTPTHDDKYHLLVATALEFAIVFW